MEENLELTVEKREENRLLSAKWFRILLIVQTVLLVNMLLAPLQLPLRLVGWLTMAMTAVTILALFSLRGVQPRYGQAALYLGIGLAGDLLTEITGASLFGSLLSICSIIGQYQEFHGHGELMADREPAMAGQWSSLFYWQMGVGLLSGLGAVVGVVIAVGLHVPEDTIITATLLIVALMAGAVQFVYLRYLKRMLKLLQT